MLELDLLLVPFARTGVSTLTPQQQALYAEFLRNEDQDLYAWLMLRSPLPDPRYSDLVQRILENPKIPD